MLTEEDTADRIALKSLFDKRRVNKETKAGFFYFEDQDLMIAQGQETYVVVARDIAVGFPLFMHGELDFSKFVDALALITEQKGKHIDTIWDIGANIGSICIPAVKRGFVKKAVAFEPEKQLFKLLRANTILNEVDDRITCHNTALGESLGSVDLMIGEDNTGDYRIAGTVLDDDAMGEASRQTKAVQIQPMDNFVENFEASSTLIFMDIQGYEGLALKGARQILSTSPPLVVEFWPYAMKRLNTYQLLCDILCSGYYSKFADLSDESRSFNAVNVEAIDAVYKKLGEGSTSFTDLLFV
jgi:FkbM family methyltransferase